MLPKEGSDFDECDLPVRSEEVLKKVDKQRKDRGQQEGGGCHGSPRPATCSFSDSARLSE